MEFRLIKHAYNGLPPLLQTTVQRRNSPNSRWSFVLVVYTSPEAPPVLEKDGAFGFTLRVGEVTIFLT